MNIFFDNFEKYANPDVYDKQYGSYMKDLPLLLEWATKQGGRVGDLACGTGRITLPLAQQGFTLTGVDLQEGMLNTAREKSKELTIHWVLQDCTKLDLQQKYRFMYMTGNSFQHFLTNDSQNNLLQSIHHHLENAGIFIFGTRYPKLKELAEIDESVQEYTNHRGQKIQETNLEEYNPLTQILHCKSIRKILNEEGKIDEIQHDSISLRYVYPLEMERLLTQNGFKIEHAYGSWDKSPLSDDSHEMIYVCRKISS
ncbi:class I SAM-dependent methyltransferase [Peribacillus acanthi]|uniref:class I SAM-dependent methyltransferase n=1 Tax=Peribacillus acanthi TaxID=2171554 RepID=UPI001F0BCBD8|nr:class I SAM-dependent methyltransferase [Peribacillus acanthi]